jgi:hypothetical protein
VTDPEPHAVAVEHAVAAHARAAALRIQEAADLAVSRIILRRFGLIRQEPRK